MARFEAREPEQELKERYEINKVSNDHCLDCLCKKH